MRDAHGHRLRDDVRGSGDPTHIQRRPLILRPMRLCRVSLCLSVSTSLTILPAAPLTVAQHHIVLSLDIIQPAARQGCRHPGVSAGALSPLASLALLAPPRLLRTSIGVYRQAMRADREGQHPRLRRRTTSLTLGLNGWNRVAGRTAQCYSVCVLDPQCRMRRSMAACVADEQITVQSLNCYTWMRNGVTRPGVQGGKAKSSKVFTRSFSFSAPALAAGCRPNAHSQVTAHVELFASFGITALPHPPHHSPSA
jgi:hypothetical protein